MSLLVNLVRLIGNVSGEPNIRHLHNGKSMARFSVATSETLLKATGECVHETQWHTVVAFGMQALRAERQIRKGAKVAITGRLKNRKYNDEAGRERFTSEVVIENLVMLGPGKPGHAGFRQVHG